MKQRSCDQTRNDRASKFSGDTPRINTKRFQPLSDGFTMFTKKFIFVHFVHCRIHRPFDSILAAGNDRTHCPLRIETISSRIERKLEPGELASTFVSILYQRLDGLVSKWMIWSTDQTGRGRAT